MAIKNYMALTMEAAERALGKKPSGEDVLRWLFESGIADSGRARRAQIKYEILELTATGLSKHAAANALRHEHHCMGEDRIRAMAYDVDGPGYLTKAAFLKIRSLKK
jgi:hypothetical protein